MQQARRGEGGANWCARSGQLGNGARSSHHDGRYNGPCDERKEARPERRAAPSDSRYGQNGRKNMRLNRRYVNDHPRREWEQCRRDDQDDDENDSADGHQQQACHVRVAKRADELWFICRAKAASIQDGADSPLPRSVAHDRRHQNTNGGPALPTMEELQQREKDVLRQLFTAQAATLQADLQGILLEKVQQSFASVYVWLQHMQQAQHQWMVAVDDYIFKAIKFADRLGNEARSDPSRHNLVRTSIPVAKTFERLHTSLHSVHTEQHQKEVSMAQAEGALRALGLSASTTTPAVCRPASPDVERSARLLQLLKGGKAVFLADNISPALPHQSSPQQVPKEMPSAAEHDAPATLEAVQVAAEHVSNDDTHLLLQSTDAEAALEFGPAQGAADKETAGNDDIANPPLLHDDSATGDDNDDDNVGGVVLAPLHAALHKAAKGVGSASAEAEDDDYAEGSPLRDLFADPPPSVMQHPTPRQRAPRKQKVFDHSELRRSERQRTSRFRNLPMEERAQRVLSKRLGYLQEGHDSVEHALQEYLGLYQGALPQGIVAALVVLFKLDDQATLQRDEALINIAGEDAPNILEQLADGASA
ncbi:unnamed protein product [Urochloa humidicola]